MNNRIQEEDQRNSREIQRDIRETRSEMDQTLDQLNQQLSPRALINGVMDWFERDDRPSVRSNANRKSQDLVQFVQENPLPALLTGAGIAWMLTEAKRDKSPDYDLDDPYDYDTEAHYRDDLYRVRTGENGHANGGQSVEGTSFPSVAQGEHYHELDNDEDGTSIKDKMSDKLDAAKSRLSDHKETASAKSRQAREAARRRAMRARQKSRKLGSQAQEQAKAAVEDYPLGVGLGIMGLGLLTGMLLPRTEREDEMLGRHSDDLLEAAKEKGQDLAERGKAVAGRVADRALAEADEQGLSASAATDKAGTLKEKIATVAEAAKEEARTAAKDENLTKEDLEQEAKAEANKATDEAEARATT